MPVFPVIEYDLVCATSLFTQLKSLTSRISLSPSRVSSMLHWKIIVDGVLKGVMIVGALGIVVGADLAVPWFLHSHPEMKAVAATIGGGSAKAILDLVLIRIGDVELGSKIIPSAHDSTWPSRIRALIVDEVAQFAVQRRVLAPRHVAQAVLVCFLVEKFPAERRLEATRRTYSGSLETDHQ